MHGKDTVSFYMSEIINVCHLTVLEIFGIYFDSTLVFKRLINEKAANTMYHIRKP